MIRILHAADLHLDSPFEGLPEEKAALRRAEQRGLLMKLPELCEAGGVQLVLLAGDLFDSAGSYAETWETLSQSIERIGVPVFIAPGNHDWYGPVYGRSRLPENAHVFAPGRMDCVSLPELGARVWGEGFADRYSAGLLRGFHAEKLDGVTDIMCIHGETDSPQSRYNPVLEDEIAASGMDYIALGHVHSYSGARRAGNTVYAWPGCPEGRGFDETGEKGVIVADVAPGEASLSFVPLGGRRYEVLEADVTGRDPVEAVLAALPPDSENNIYRIMLTGESEEAIRVPELMPRLAGRAFSLQIRDATRLREDLWARADEDSLRGAFLRRLREKYAAAGTDAERDTLTQAARWGLAALDNREEAVRL